MRPITFFCIYITSIISLAIVTSRFKLRFGIFQSSGGSHEPRSGKWSRPVGQTIFYQFLSFLSNALDVIVNLSHFSQPWDITRNIAFNAWIYLAIFRTASLTWSRIPMNTYKSKKESISKFVCKKAFFIQNLTIKPGWGENQTESGQCKTSNKLSTIFFFFFKYRITYFD